MNKGVITAVVAVVIALVAGFFFLTNNKGSSNENIPAAQEAVDSNQMVDCGSAENPGCFLNRMSQCLPVTVKMIATDGATEIGLTVLGVKNETCHFQRKISNVLDLDCYFPRGTLSSDTLAQMFGEDKGLQEVVDSSCKSAGW